MVDNIKISKSLLSLSATKRVKPVDDRQNNNHQDLFKESFKERQKKKKTKEDPMHVKISGRGATASRAQHTRHTVTNKKSKESSRKRIIDIRV
jgi:hypothetical protein